jgi:histidine triad (HIT) family protein
MEDCLFCKIAQGAIPSTRVYEDTDVIAFRDIAPQAPHHIIFIPRQHLASSFATINKDTQPVVMHLLSKIQEVAAQLGLEEHGYRVLTNVGDDAGQTVHHLHFHLLGGRPLGVLASPEKP